jgi:hypothetical protein
MSSLSDALPQHAHQQQNTQTSPPSRPEYLVIGLFALRITKRLVQQLDPYDGHGADLNWLKRFLQPYRAEHALAKLTDARAIDDYVRNYPAMVRRMIKQPRYRRVFMDMNPDKKVTDRELSDSKPIPMLRLGLVKKEANVFAEELRAIVDFADAAAEWGSVVPLPAKYATRMEELAKERRMAT